MKKMKISFSNISLKWKIFGFLIGFCTILLIILWLFQTVFLESFYKTVKVMELKKSVSIIENNINTDELSDIILNISQNNDICIDIISENGLTLYSYDYLKGCIIHKLSFNQKAKLLEKVMGEDKEYYQYAVLNKPGQHGMGKNFLDRLPPNDPSAQTSLIYVKRIAKSSGEQVFILMNSLISPVNATVNTLRYQLYFITFIMIAFSIVLAFLIAKRVSKPIEKINTSAKELAKGNYNINFDGKGFLEISELSNTLNTTAYELNKVESLRRELMANISHDLRTPLSLIYGYAEVMHDFKDEITDEQTQTIMDETMRLSSLVNDVLDISKLEAGIENLNTRTFNLTLSIKNTVERVSKLINKDNYALEFSYQEEVLVYADEIKITQAFYNLLINAINYTGEDKHVFINQIIIEDKVVIEVVDTGEGIDKEIIPYIWDRYYKSNKLHKRAVTGTGLGLSIVKKVIDLHGGECGVMSRPNIGSTFWFSLKYEKAEKKTN